VGSRFKRVGLLLFCLVLLTGFGTGILHGASADDGPGWFGSDAPTLTKLLDLPVGTGQVGNSNNCAPYTYVAPGAQQSTTVCTFESPLGKLSDQGTIQTGLNVFVRLTGTSNQLYFLPAGNPAVGVVSIPSWPGNEVGVYQNLSKADLKVNFGSGGAPYYTVPTNDGRIKLVQDWSRQQPLQAVPGSIAFSANSDWMVANMPNRGLVRVNMSDLTTQQFAGPIEPGGFSGTESSVPMAVSDDGRYVAINSDVYGSNNLILYDLSTCSDQLGKMPGQAHYCTGRNLWFGEAGQPGLRSLDNTLMYPSRLRFTDDSNLDFSANYNGPGGGLRLASFVVSAPGATQHGLGLLGMGDSYISGQGAYVYRDNSNTANDQCHVSDLSYPSTLGAEYFDSYNSVACSGAKTRNVSPQVDEDQTLLTYTGQVKDNIQEGKRGKQNILDNFLPGYIYQQEFVEQYKPNVILVSVGGDDIAFSDIITQCVLPTDGNTCYDTYEDRAELVNEIDNTYSNLVTTYQTLRQQSNGARIYVVGYPQIVKPGGNCGLNVHLDAEELTFSEQLTDYLDGVVQQAAGAAGVMYVDTQHAFDGHRLCETGAKAMNGLTVTHTLGSGPAAPESYHPTSLGYQLLADTVAQQTSDLTAPMPAATTGSAPKFDPSLSILAEVPISGRKINWVTHQDSIAGDILVRGNAQQVTVDGSEVQLQPGSGYQIVLHSTPVLLGTGSVGADGNISNIVTIPADMAPGYHVLHLYSTDMAGDPVDIQKLVYVAASIDDYDGDNVLNGESPCLILPPSGQDVDRDSIDDACDPEITDAPQVIAAINRPDVSTAAVNSPATTTSNHPETIADTSIAQQIQAATGITQATNAVLGDNVTSGASVVSPKRHIGASHAPQKLIQQSSTPVVRWFALGGLAVLLTLFLRYRHPHS